MIPPEIAILGGLRDRDLAAEGLVVAEGRLVVERLLSLPAYAPRAVLATPATARAMALEARDDLPLFEAGEAEIAAFAGYPFHRGVLAVAKRPPAAEAGSLLPGLEAALWPPLLVLPETRDPENLGALVRSAAAFGFGAVLLGPGCPDFLSRRALRVSMGAVLSMPHARLGSAEDFAAFASVGYSLVAAVVDPEAPDISEWVSPTPCAIALGDEYAGLGSSWLGASGGRVTIAMAPGPDSLNVAAAGALLMWKLASARRG
ncbi:MAG TPA: RNA methyltransferase [Rectinemataceae bacterium]|nr:RNA methyltransferase [Rectinemataceae bacterium]